MSEPIVLYDKDGGEVTVYGAAQAAALLAARTAFRDKPVKGKTVDAAEVAEEAAEATATGKTTKAAEKGKK